jgi:predicted aspartyl protease
VTQHFEPRRRAIILWVELLGPLRTVRLRLLLDTGSAYTVVDPIWLQRAGYDLDSPRSFVPIATASSVERYPHYDVSHVAALGKVSRDLAVLGHALPRAARLDGLLGMNFFGDRRLTIDFGDGTVSLE